MWREATALEPRANSFPWVWAPRYHRSVLVKVLDGSREVDGFQASGAETMRAALRPIYRHLPKKRGTVQFIGIEEQVFPLGIRGGTRKIDLNNFGAAVMFLAG
jgi:hypothetical protein